MFTPYDRPSYRRLSRDERIEVVRGFKDVRYGSVLPKWNDTRDELLESAHSALDEVIGGQLDDDEPIAACWAIGRDLATARYLRSPNFHETFGFTSRASGR